MLSIDLVSVSRAHDEAERSDSDCGGFHLTTPDSPAQEQETLADGDSPASRDAVWSLDLARLSQKCSLAAHLGDAGGRAGAVL